MSALLPPGWYRNTRGALQWWDGTAWGPLAPEPPAPSGRQENARRRSAFAWIGLASALAALILLIGDGWAWALPGPVRALAYAGALLAIVLAVVGHSLGRVALLLTTMCVAAFAIASKVLFVAGSWAFYLLAGIFGQLTGQPIG